MNKKVSKKRIYLASPYTHNSADVRETRYELVLKTAVELSENYVVYSPIMHWHPAALRHKLPTTFDFWIEQNHSMIDACDELFILCIDGWDCSNGVADEINYAKTQNKPIHYFRAED